MLNISTDTRKILVLRANYRKISFSRSTEGVHNQIDHIFTRFSKVSLICVLLIFSNVFFSFPAITCDLYRPTRILAFET